MASENETIADIVADIRAQNQGLPEDGYALSPLVCDLLSLADRIEVAAKQEVTDCNQLGNSAKMREALLMILDTVDHLQTRFAIPKLASEEILELKQIAESALSAPPRNCDRPECATTKAAQDVWRKEDGGKTAYYEWLLAESTKGGAE